MQDTLIIIKPDAIERGLVGEIITRFEAAGFEIVRLQFEQMSEGLMRRFYEEHQDKPHFARLIAYMTSAPLLFMHLRREEAVDRARALLGNTDPACAASGTIRGDLGLDLPRNAVHASDCPEAARREMGLIFGS